MLYFSSVEGTVVKHDMITILSSKSAEYPIQALGISGRYFKLEQSHMPWLNLAVLCRLTLAEELALNCSKVWMCSKLYFLMLPCVLCCVPLLLCVINSLHCLICNLFVDFSIKIAFFLRLCRHLHCMWVYCILYLQGLHPTKAILSATNCCNLLNTSSHLLFLGFL